MKLTYRKSQTPVRTSKHSNKQLSSLEFTPGTAMMHAFTNWLNFWACQHLLRVRTRNLTVSVNGVECDGEGEHKIQQHRLSSKTIPPNDVRETLIIGADADLFLQMFLSADEFTGDTTYFCQVERRGSELPDQVFSSVAFRKALNVKLTKVLGSKVNDMQVTGVMHDLAFISLLLGNDYLPRLRGVGIVSLWRNYLKVLKHSPNTFIYNKQKECINIEPFLKLCELVLSQLANGTVSMQRQGNDDAVDTDEDDGIDDEDSNSNAVQIKPLPETVLNTLLSHRIDQVFTESIPTSCVADPAHYLKGLVWTLNMLATGTSKDWTYEYSPRQPCSLDIMINFSKLFYRSTLKPFIHGVGTKAANCAHVPALLIPVTSKPTSTLLDAHLTEDDTSKIQELESKFIDCSIETLQKDTRAFSFSRVYHEMIKLDTTKQEKPQNISHWQYVIDRPDDKTVIPHVDFKDGSDVYRIQSRVAKVQCQVTFESVLPVPTSVDYRPQWRM